MANPSFAKASLGSTVGWEFIHTFLFPQTGNHQVWLQTNHRYPLILTAGEPCLKLNQLSVHWQRILTQRWKKPQIHLELLIHNRTNVFKEQTCILQISVKSVDVIFVRNDSSTWTPFIPVLNSLFFSRLNTSWQASSYKHVAPWLKFRKSH